MTARVGAWPRVQAPLAEHLPARRPARQLPSLRQATSADGVGRIALLVRTGGVRLSRRDTDRGRLTVQARWRSPRDLGPWQPGASLSTLTLCLQPYWARLLMRGPLPPACCRSRCPPARPHPVVGDVDGPAGRRRPAARAARHGGLV